MQQFFKITHLVSYGLILLSSSCASDIVEVEYAQMISPIEAYGELKKLAVGIDPKIDGELKNQILSSLKSCPVFSEIAVMDKPVRVSGSNPKDYFDALIKRSETAQTAQGVLSLQLEDNTQVEQMEKSQAIQIDDQSQEDWYPSFGVPNMGTYGFPTSPEVAPLSRVKRREAFIRIDKSQYILRMVLYNRVTSKIVHDRLFNVQASLHNYSRKPSVKKDKFLKLVEQSVVNEAMFHVCPSKAKLKRQLVYAKKGDAVSKEINEGVDLASENRWGLAATKWNNALIKEPKNAFAHHNLAIHLEKQGEFFKALTHFKAAQPKSPKEASTIKNFPEPVYPQIQEQYLPRFDSSQVYPQIAFVTGGSWAYVRSDGKPLPVQKRASLYRMETIVNPDSSRVTGIALREVGVIRTLASTGPYFPARIKEFLLEYPVKAGDLLIND